MILSLRKREKYVKNSDMELFVSVLNQRKENYLGFKMVLSD